MSLNSDTIQNLRGFFSLVHFRDFCKGCMCTPLAAGPCSAVRDWAVWRVGLAECRSSLYLDRWRGCSVLYLPMVSAAAVRPNARCKDAISDATYQRSLTMQHKFLTSHARLLLFNLRQKWLLLFAQNYLLFAILHIYVQQKQMVQDRKAPLHCARWYCTTDSSITSSV